MTTFFLGDLPGEPRLQWSLTAVGLLALLAAFLPGGWKLTAWTGHLKSWHRVCLFFIGVGLLAVAWLTPRPDSSTVAPITSPTNEEFVPLEPAVVDAVDSVEPQPEEPMPRLTGFVKLGNNELPFENIYENYHMTVDTATGGVSTRLDRTGEFSLNVSIVEATGLTVSWHWAKPSDFVIWPLEQPVDDSVGQLEFHFARVSDVFVREKGAILEQIVVGQFDAAHDRLDTLKKLLIRVEGEQDRVDGSHLVGKARRWTYTIHRDIAKKAGVYRRAHGVTQVDSATWMKERVWLRAAIAAAIEQNTADVGRDLSRALNNWATFSRQVYRHGGEAWPDRRMSACADRLRLREATYCEYLREDIELVLSSLGSGVGQTLLAGIQGTQESVLRSKELRAVKTVQTRSIDLAVDDVKLHHLAWVLNALNKFVDGEEQRTVARGSAVGTEEAGRVS